MSSDYRVNASFPKDVYDWITDQSKDMDISRSAFVKITMRQVMQQQEMNKMVRPMMDFIKGLSPDLMDAMVKGKNIKVKDRKKLESGLKLLQEGMQEIEYKEVK